jgi:hypothetical protein
VQRIPLSSLLLEKVACAMSASLNLPLVQLIPSNPELAGQLGRRTVPILS